jgi:hypothetical protein
LEFLFERQTGFFLLQIYTPLTLIVFCSWVAFWLMNTANVGVAAGRFYYLIKKKFFNDVIFLFQDDVKIYAIDLFSRPLSARDVIELFFLI